MPSLVRTGRAETTHTRMDVVLVHGLNGHPHDTWCASGTGGYWPAWLADDVQDVAVWSLGYAATLTEWFKSADPMLDEAVRVLHLLRLKGIGERPIVFVAHSLGGLLVKALLRLADGGMPEMHHLLRATHG